MAQPILATQPRPEEQDILLGLPAKGKRSALARLAAHLGDRVNMSQGVVLVAMLRRERLGSTAIGNVEALDWIEFFEEGP